jgi:transposase
MDGRQLRGLEIAQKGGISKNMKGYIVPSQYGSGTYVVQRLGGQYTCSCPDCQTRNVKCKHQYAGEFWIQKTRDAEGRTTVTKAMRITYPQNWEAYNKAQTQEITMFDQLLKGLVETIQEDAPEQRGRGRLALSIRENLFCAIQKVYSQLSQRRAHTLYRNAEEREQIEHTPHFNAVGKLLNKKEATAILHHLLSLSAAPLQGVETTFAQDSSGFRTTQFNEYCKEKHHIQKKHEWVKAHILVGTKTNVIVSARITEGDGADCPQFEPLLLKAHGNGFNVKEITADKAYTSRENYNVANSIGAVAYLPFKKNDGGKSRGSLTWAKMYHYFMLNRDEFMEHYHQRSNVESAFNMIKAKFGDKLKSKNWTAQVNELLCKLIAHNIVVLIHEIHELGITPNFCTLNPAPAPLFIQNPN